MLASFIATFSLVAMIVGYFTLAFFAYVLIVRWNLVTFDFRRKKPLLMFTLFQFGFMRYVKTKWELRELLDEVIEHQGLPHWQLDNGVVWVIILPKWLLRLCGRCPKEKSNAQAH
jgi:hypothetical protein